MIEIVHLESSTYQKNVSRFEAGTPASADIIGLSAAVDYLRKIGMNDIHQHTQSLTAYALEGLQQISGVKIVGPPDMVDRGAVISFTVDGIHPHDVGQFLDADGVAVRVGHHCAWPVCRRFEVPATTRASFYMYNEKSEIDVMLDAIAKTQKYFGV